MVRKLSSDLGVKLCIALGLLLFVVGCGPAGQISGGGTTGTGGGTSTASLSVTTATLPAATISTPYSAALGATGGNTPYSWTVVSGNLPSGLTLSAAGIISGTPTVAGVFNFTVQVTDSSTTAQTSSRTLTLTVIAPSLVINTPSLPGGTVGVAYSNAVVASGGTAPITFAVTAGTPPTGLALSTAGVLAGTPTTLGTFTFTVTATDAGSQTISRQFQVVIAPTALVVTTTTLPSGTTGVAYSTTLTATGGTLPYTWTVVGGALHTGLGLSTGGVISGTPTSAGTNLITFRVTDASSQQVNVQLPLTISAPPLAITTATLPGGIVSTPYSQTVTTTGGLAPITFVVSAGTLPAGLGLTGATGDITGTPTTPGTSIFSIQANDSSGQSVSVQYSITIVPTSLMITTAGLPGGSVGTAYSTTVVATGGTPGYTWSQTAGTMPPGLGIDAAGNITGTPTTAGNFTFTVQVTDSAAQSQTRQFTIGISASSLTINTLALPDGTVGVAYNQTVTATGGTGTGYSFVISAGALPAGLTISSGGTISGSPTTTQSNVMFTVQVTDSGANTATQTYTVNINPSALQISTLTLPNGQATVAYSQSISATGGTPPVTFTVSAGALPNGLALSTAGLLSGTPTTPGNFTFTVQAADSGAQVATRQYTVAIAAAPLNLVTTSVPNGLVNSPYSSTLTASGGTTPYTWTVTVGTLPTGLILNAGSGLLSGTPTVIGSSTVTIQVADSGGQSAQRQFTIDILPTPVSIQTTTLPDTVLGASYNSTVTATGGIAPYTFIVSAGVTPPGLTLATNGTMSGTSTTVGTYTFTVQVTDTAAQVASRQFTVNVVAPPLAFTTTSLPDAQVGTGYTALVQATGGVIPYTFTIISGTLPSGITMNTAGLVDGTPAAAGTSTFTVQVQDSIGQTATRSLSLTVQPAALVITTNTLPNASPSTPYNATLTASGGTTPYTWAIVGGSLPPGLTLLSSGSITGTASTTGQYTFFVQVTDATNQNANRQLTINVVPVFRITADTIWGGILNTPFQQTVTTADATGPVVFTVTAGALPPGLSLSSSSGAITGTPTTLGEFTFTVRAQDPATAPTASYFMIISPNDSNYGNVGDPYASEGGVPLPGSTLISACQNLSSNTKYRLLNNVSAATAGTTCFKLGPGTVLDLGGFMVTGRVTLNANVNATALFNGIINCTWADSGGDSGCVNFASSNSFTSAVRIHHLTIHNTAVPSRAIQLDWNIPTPFPTVPSIRLFNVQALVDHQPLVSRSHAVNVTGKGQFLVMFNNDVTCAGDAAACQGLVCQTSNICKLHHNRAMMVQNTTPETGRALVFQTNNFGEAWNNVVTAFNNRAVRIRDSFNIRVHDNTFVNLTPGEGAVHLADPDTGDNDLNALIDNNNFQMSGGTAVFIRSGFNALVRNNNFTCLGACASSQLAAVRKPNPTGSRSELVLEHNNSITLFAAPPQSIVENGATISLCDSGTAGPFNLSLGTIINVPSCP